MLLSKDKAKDLYRGHKLECNVQRKILRGEETGLNYQVVRQVIEFGIVAPIGLDEPYKCKKCNAKIICVPCVACQIRSLKKD